jgi:hypothetical protein
MSNYLSELSNLSHTVALWYCIDISSFKLISLLVPEMGQDGTGQSHIILGTIVSTKGAHLHQNAIKFMKTCIIEYA